MSDRIKKALIVVLVFVLGLAAGWSLFYFIDQENVVSADEIKEKIVNYVNEEVLGENLASVTEVIDAGDVYRISLTINGQDYESYATKDGTLLFPEAYTMTEPEAVKRDVPDVKLFVMSYCPYGLQAEKMFLPVYDLLKGKADMGVYFVDYIMHGKDEIDENLNQYCVQKEENEKFSAFLSCFVESGNSDSCFSEAGVDKGKIDSCVLETDEAFSITSLYEDQSTWLSGAYPQFNVESDMNEQYEVQGSPTVVINDKVVSINPRTPDNFKKIVCESFNEAPEECSQVLSTEVPSTGIGGGTGSSNSGSCQ